MLHRALCGFAAALLTLVAQPAQAAETVRITLADGVQQVVIEGASLAWGEDVDGADFTELGRARTSAALSGTALTLDGAVMPVESLRLRAGGTDATVTVNGTRLRGDVVLVRGRKGLDAINVLPLEDYLVGVLGSEMPTSFPPQALKAQAVAARTYALSRKLDQLGNAAHLTSSVISQVYKGLEVEDPRTREAVESTRGQVLTWQLQPIEAYFHASCGGHTAAGGEALNRDLPYLRSVACPCKRLPTSHWSLNLKRSDVKGLSSGRSDVLRVQGRSPTGRAQRVQLGSRSLDAVTFRARVGYMKLKSLDFEVAQAKDGWVLTGHGFGHGAGLCQWGARVLADQGKGYEQILSHYYPGTELQTLY